MKKHYVCGFMFNKDRTVVVLIRKRHPLPQSGKLNGVGGVVEPGEAIADAMPREFEEETGVKTTVTQWREYATLVAGQAIIHFFECEDAKYSLCKTQPRPDSEPPEEIGQYDMSRVHTLPLVRSVSWLIPLACDPSKSYTTTTTLA